MEEQRDEHDVEAWLSAAHASLAHGVAPAVPGTIYALGVAGGIVLGPREGRVLLFGRNRPDVHVCIGEDDLLVSRQHGELVHHGRQWWVRNTGRYPLRLPRSRLLYPDEAAVPLTPGYTPLFVSGSLGREHLLELYVTGPDGKRPVPRHSAVTQPPRLWRLSPDERLGLIALGQRYLRHEPHPQPLSWRETADLLADRQPGVRWTSKRVEHMVTAVRERLSQGGVAGLTREEIGEPVGNVLNENLIRALMMSTTLVPPDLDLLDDEPGAPGPRTGP